MQIDPNFRKHASAMVKVLLTKLTKSKDRNSSPVTGSMEESGAISLGVLPEETEFIFSNGISLRNCVKGECLGFDALAYPDYEKFVDDFSKGNALSASISRDFISEVTFEWLIKTKRGELNEDFFEWIVPKLKKSIKTYRFYFKVLYLQIEKSFSIGDVQFDFIRRDFFDNLGNAEDADIEAHREEFYQNHKGDVYVTAEEVGEKGKAREIALARCSLAIDVLKICSHTLEQPDLKLSFDIDTRTRETPQGEYFTESDGAKGINLRRPPMNFQMDSIQWGFFVKRSMNAFARAVFARRAKTELEALVQQAISMLADALSVTDYHQRIAQLFTIMESILILDSRSNIQDTMSKYCAKLTRQSLEKRRELIKFIKDMYKIRSNYMHYAQKNHFEMKDLRMLQIVVHQLILSVIGKFDEHKTKATLLREIDDAMIAA